MVAKVSWEQAALYVPELRILAWKAYTDPNLPGAQLSRLIEPLDSDPRTNHFVCESSGVLVGAARVTIGYLPSSITSRVNIGSVATCALFSRLVVHPDYRGRGIARDLDIARMDDVNLRGGLEIWAEAAPWRVNAMKLLGFRSVLPYIETDAVFINQQVTVMCFKEGG